MPGNDDYKTENLIDYLHHQNYCKRIGIDLKNQTNTNIPQQISYIGKLEEWCSNVFYCWKAAKNDSKLFFRFVNCNRIILEHWNNNNNNIGTSKNVKFVEGSKQFKICDKK